MTGDGLEGRHHDAVPPWLEAAAAVAWRSLVVFAALAVLVLVLARLHLIVLPVLIALIAAALFVPLSAWLERLGTPRALASTLAVLAGLLALLGLGALVGMRIAREVSGFDLAEVRRQVVSFVQDGPFGLSPAQVRDYLQQATSALQQNIGRIIGGVLAGTLLLIEIVTVLLLTLILTFFFVRDREQLGSWLLERVRRPEQRAIVARVAGRAWGVLSGYIRGLTIIAAIEAVGIGLGLVIIGVPLVLTLSVLVFVGAFIPVVGAFVSGFIAVLVALVSGGLTDALLVFAVVVVVNQIDAHILQPVIMGHSVPLHPVAVMIALTAGAILWGIPGAALAVPAAAAVAAGGTELRDIREERRVGAPTARPPAGRASSA